MAVIGWGKPKVEICAFVNGAMPTTPVWTAIDNIKEDTTKLSTSKGSKMEAKLEGGALLDAKYASNNYSLELEVYAAKGKTKPITDVDGVVSENYAVRITPEDETQTGYIIDKSSVQVEDNFTSKDGKTWKYTFEALKPTSGAMLKEYTKA